MPEQYVPDPEPQIVDKEWNRKTAHGIQDWMRKMRNAFQQGPARHAKTHRVGGGDALPIPGPPTTVIVGTAAAASIGSGPAYMREDAQLVVGGGTPSNATGTAAAAGSAATVMRSDATVKQGIVTTKGDVLTHNATVPARLAVGTNGHVLTADSGEATGLKWAAAAGTSEEAMALAYLMGD